jgi:hypothetical protein
MAQPRPGASPSSLRSPAAFLAVRPVVDWLVALALAAIVWLMGYEGRPLVDLLDPVGRRATYQFLAVLSRAMMGLTVTTAGLILANLDKPIATMPEVCQET